MTAFNYSVYVAKQDDEEDFETLLGQFFTLDDAETFARAKADMVDASYTVMVVDRMTDDICCTF